MVKQILTSLTVLMLLTGCLKNSSSSYNCTSSYDPCAFKASAAEIQSVQDYLTTNGITAMQHCSGLFYTIDNPGSGATPSVCSNVSVTYDGRLTNGNVFDSTATPVLLNLSRVIIGWANGLPLIKAGGSMHLYIPPSLGYGTSTVGSIPANSILVFKVNLIAVQ